MYYIICTHQESQRGCLMEVRGAQNIHSLKGTKNHPFVTPGI